jgi:hypothetical protein
MELRRTRAVSHGGSLIGAFASVSEADLLKAVVKLAKPRHIRPEDDRAPARTCTDGPSQGGGRAGRRRSRDRSPPRARASTHRRWHRG